MKVFHVETLHDGEYAEIVSLLQSGGIVAFPTDTAYGLGCDPYNERSVDRLFAAKGRVETKPILLLVNSLAMAESISAPRAIFYRVAERFWPGPLTLITQAAGSLPAKVTAGTGTIGLRWPIALCATTIIGRMGKPITATSANISGLPACVTAAEVRDQLEHSIDALVDGGLLPARGGSTMLDLTADTPVVVRDGPVTFEVLDEFFAGRVRRQVA